MLFPRFLSKAALAALNAVHPFGDVFWLTIHAGLRGPEFRLTGTCPWTNAALLSPPSLLPDSKQGRESRGRTFGKTKEGRNS